MFQCLGFDLKENFDLVNQVDEQDVQWSRNYMNKQMGASVSEIVG